MIHGKPYPAYQISRPVGLTLTNNTTLTHPAGITLTQTLTPNSNPNPSQTH